MSRNTGALATAAEGAVQERTFVYMGLPLGAAVLLRAGIRLRAICVWHKDSPGFYRLKALARRTPELLLLVQPNLEDPELQRVLATTGATSLLSWFWPKRIPLPLLQAFSDGAYGVHPSLLPRWRGPDPYFWAIAAGDDETGVSLHHLGEQYDTGDVIETEALPVAPGWNSWKLARALDRPSLRLLVRCAERVQREGRLLGQAQDKNLVTLAPAPSEDDLAIDWDLPAVLLERLVRAASPVPGAAAFIGDNPVVLITATVYAGKMPRALQPSECMRTDSGIAVMTGEGGLEITEARVDDDEVVSGKELHSLLE